LAFRIRGHAAMTPELKWLVFTALFVGSLWIPFIVGVNVTTFEGKERLFERPPDHSKMAPWVHRSLRAHQNALEQLLPFAVIVIAGAVSGVSTSTTTVCAITFFWLRVAHAVGMISGLARFPVRPAIYFTNWIVMFVYAWQVLSGAPR
jgi:uncharacterized MAPEG superfamily protein